MVSPPDSENPPPAPAAAPHQNLTLNAPASAADVDAASDLRLQPEADLMSIFVPEDAPLEQRDSDPASAQAQPTRGDSVQPDTYIIWPVDDDDRSWWSRLRSLKAPWGRKYFWRSAHREPMATDANMPGPAARTGEVTMEAIRNLEKHLASLAALRDACESIDRRLARVEEVSRQRDHATVDEGLRDVCWQMSDRLVRIESAVQHTEDTLHRREDIVAEWLEDFSARMVARLAETEETIQRLERERAAVADMTLHELRKNIDARLEQTETTLHGRDSIVTEWLQELSADMTARFAEAEEAIQRIEQIVSSRTVEQRPTTTRGCFMEGHYDAGARTVTHARAARTRY